MNGTRARIGRSALASARKCRVGSHDVARTILDSLGEHPRRGRSGSRPRRGCRAGENRGATFEVEYAARVLERGVAVAKVERGRAGAVDVGRARDRIAAELLGGHEAEGPAHVARRRVGARDRQAEVPEADPREPGAAKTFDGFMSRWSTPT